MLKIPVRYKRITAAFDDVARAWLCESSGSEHSAAENSGEDLSDLVESFIEREGGVQGVVLDDEEKKNELGEEDERGYLESYTEYKEMLMSLIGGDHEAEEGDGRVKRMISGEVEIACRSLGINRSSEGFKRRVTSWLRQRGFDAGLCKSRWEKTGGRPAGEYEYIDVIISKTRYIIEIALTAEFTVARPTNLYSALLEVFPQVLVCREGELKQLVRVMCGAMRQSIRKSDMPVPPWRKNAYMQSKWFGPHRRTNILLKAMDI